MEAKELRIGNYVQALLGEVMKVKQLGSFDNPGYISAENEQGAAQNMFEPTPLTEDWLLRFGFEKARTFDHDNRYFIGENPVTKDWMLYLTWLDNTDAPFYKNGFHVIKYVHQLQNLYFALTGEELKEI